MRRLLSICMVAAGAGLASCDDPATPGGTGWLRASLSGAVSGTYEGNGAFLVQTDREEGPRKMFSLDSRSDSLYSQTFSFTRQNGTRPRPGRYSLELVGPHNQNGDRYYAAYHRVSGNVLESYTAVSGYIEITRSSDDRVEGTFHMVGKRYCPVVVSGWDPAACALPWAPPANEPEIEVTGSFSAVPDGPEEVVQ